MRRPSRETFRGSPATLRGLLSWTGVGRALEQPTGPTGCRGRTLLLAGMHHRRAMRVSQCPVVNHRFQSDLDENPSVHPGRERRTIDPIRHRFVFDRCWEIDLNDNKFSGRVDGNSRFGLLTAYYYFDKFDRIDPYWPSNAPLYPGFDVDGKGLTHNINLGDIKTLSSASVNEFRLGYFRLNQKLNQPLGGKGTMLGRPGICFRRWWPPRHLSRNTERRRHP